MDPVIDNEETTKNIPIFSLGNPFDNIKIIAHTIMGSPRLNYDWNGYNIVAKTLKNEENEDDIWLVPFFICIFASKI